MSKEFIFFGTDDFSIEVLKVLLENNFKPTYCITQPDRPKGRKLVLTPPPIKVFCEENEIKVLQPEKLSSSVIPASSTVIPASSTVIPAKAGTQAFDFFVVASFGKIIPKEILDLPKYGSLNVHPSLLPKYRGASPIETAILNDDKNTGVTIMMMDEKMDHGSLLSQREVIFEDWTTKEEIRDKLAKIGGEMICEILNHIEDIRLVEQNHQKATFTKMIKKTDGEILDTDSDKTKWLKFIAYNPWPGVFFYIYPERGRGTDKGKRIKITDAEFIDNKFVIKKVIPEGKKEISWKSFENGYLK